MQILWVVMKYNGMSMNDIIKSLGEMCREGLVISKQIKLRKAIRELAQDMRKDSKKYRKPYDKSIIVRVENK
jgi:hypothetical protein